MSRGVQIRGSQIKTFLTEKWQSVLILSLFCAGLFIGSFYINHAEGAIFEKLNTTLLEYVNGRGGQKGSEIFVSTLFKDGIFLLLVGFFGLSGVGFPLILLTPFACGISNGIITGYLYAAKGFSGLLYCVTTIYPSLIIFMASLVLGACESLNMSQHIFKTLLNKNYLGQGESLKKYALQYLILFIILLISCSIEVITVKAFG